MTTYDTATQIGDGAIKHAMTEGEMKNEHDATHYAFGSMTQLLACVISDDPNNMEYAKKAIKEYLELGKK